MQPKPRRRVHSVEFKAQVLAECQEPGVSVAAVALAHGLNVNLVRKWLVGHGIKRAGLPAPRTVARIQPATAEPAASRQFIPVELAPAAIAIDEAAAPSLSDLHIELTRGGTQCAWAGPRHAGSDFIVPAAQCAGSRVGSG